MMMMMIYKKKKVGKNKSFDVIFHFLEDFLHQIHTNLPLSRRSRYSAASNKAAILIFSRFSFYDNFFSNRNYIYSTQNFIFFFIFI